MDMQLTATLPAPTRRKRPRRHSRSNELKSQARAKRSGGPEDLALYRCECGYVFRAQVSTSVGCPHCGANQAW
jgi:rubrerythrin